jgi:hypothetical protein
VARGEDKDESWRVEPEPSSASGGHLPPDVRTEVIPRGTPELPEEPSRPQPQPAGPRRVRRRVPVRRVRRTIRKIDPWSVLKLSLFFYACFLLVWLVVVAVAYSLLDGAGLFDRIEEIREGFALGEGQFEITLWTVQRWAFVIGLVVALAATLFNVVLTFLYNIASDLIGGLEITFAEREL